MCIDSHLHRKYYISLFKKIIEKRKKMFFKEILCFNPLWPCEICKIAMEYLTSLVRCNEIFMLR